MPPASSFWMSPESCGALKKNGNRSASGLILGRPPCRPPRARAAAAVPGRRNALAIRPEASMRRPPPSRDTSVESSHSPWAGMAAVLSGWIKAHTPGFHSHSDEPVFVGSVHAGVRPVRVLQSDRRHWESGRMARDLTCQAYGRSHPDWAFGCRSKTDKGGCHGGFGSCISGAFEFLSVSSALTPHS